MNKQNFKYVIQHTKSGQVIDYCETLEQAESWKKECSCEVIEIKNASCVKVIYTEVGGPWGYGHQEESFATYGGIKPCISHLCAWMQESARTFGPDWREVRDFFNYCRLYVNGEDKSDWFFKQVAKIKPKTLFV